MDDRDLRPRHHRNPGPGERVLDAALTGFCLVVGGFQILGMGKAIHDLAAAWF
ncbi:hypothetical protein [Ruegeria atlantica]|uniref:hypothetical protein n=1 Tax=Ruegeria atlantica TaxID=81569 RepID=UPI00147B2056|nr:hypothetical protein [Ruegeria atlantica]